jgi:hypothetical protein
MISRKDDSHWQSSKAEMPFHYCWVVNTSFKVVWMESTSPCNSLIGYTLKWRCCSLVWPKSLWQKNQFLTTHLSRNRLCIVHKPTLTVNRTKYRHSQSTWLSVTVCIHVLSLSIPHWKASWTVRYISHYKNYKHSIRDKRNITTKVFVWITIKYYKSILVTQYA